MRGARMFALRRAVSHSALAYRLLACCTVLGSVPPPARPLSAAQRPVPRGGGARSAQHPPAERRRA
eukprot:365101-Chlamydomonas_euryale.AAC.2